MGLSRRILAGWGLVSAVGGLGCFARTHARVNPGWTVTLGAGTAVAPPPGRGNDPEEWRLRTRQYRFPGVDLGFQYAPATEATAGWAFQLKIPSATFDLYRQIQTGGGFDHGVGLELGLLGLVPTVYYAHTRSWGSLYLTATARVMVPVLEPAPVLNPQLAFGGGHLYALVSYFGFTGDGFDVGYVDDQAGPWDVRRHLVLIGAGLRL